jgi:3-carboxy-cis,cis-muconate cycloisomerase
MLTDCLATTDALAGIFSDESVLQAMLDFEAALARAAARAGVVPDRAAQTISALARAAEFDAAAIARDARHSATPSIPLVKALTARVASVDPESARYVHWGATSQDVSDTALVLLLQRAGPHLAADHARLDDALRAMSDRHAASVMLGRTLLQPATPTTFGLKAAGWYASAARGWRRLNGAWDSALVLQLGGAAGTRAAFGAHAATIVDAVARDLGLRTAPPWHTDRDRLGALIGSCGVYAATLGKIARDIALLMQAEVAEAFEPGGGSSTMPHKRNPAGCIVAIAAATRMPGLVAAFLTGMVQEHERAAGGSQAEWPTVSAVVQTTGAAVSSMAAVVEGLTVDTDAMRMNLEKTGGVVLAERVVMLLAPQLGRDRAQQLVMEAVRRSRESGHGFGRSLQDLPEVSRALAPDVLRDIDRPDLYLGAAEALRKELLSE